MDAACGFSLVEPPMSPRSPPAGLDFYDKRRKIVKVQALEREIVRQYDEKFGLWYIVYWDDTMKCYVTQLESGQRPVLALDE